MQSPIHPHIEAFRKAFPISVNVHQNIDRLVYFNQTYRIEDTAKQAEDLIFKNSLSLEVDFNKGLKSMTVRVVAEIDRRINFWGNVQDYIIHLQKKLN